MPHVITQSCCSDGSCVYACPVNCIQPTPDDPEFALAEMLHIDPSACVDCGACVEACPVDAIKPHTALEERELPFLEINRAYHQRPRERPLLAPVTPRLVVHRHHRPLRVAVVGSGPAGMYAADEMLTIPRARVSMFERLPVPYGLARFGVAPDHGRTRRIVRQFDQIRGSDRLELHLGVEVGRDVAHEELISRHDAVIYAVGAASDRRLEIPGADLEGVASATEFVGWYNGHPDFAARSFDLSHARAVVVGNGNVALDIARILTVDPQALAGTEIAPAALEVLRRSRIEEVVVTGRRGPSDAAFTLPELLGLASTPGVELVAETVPGEKLGSKLELVRALARRHAGATRRITLRFRLAPERMLGEQLVEGVRFASGESVAAGLVLSSIGYRARPVKELPFDERTATVPNAHGRVIDPRNGIPLPGVFVTGWIKRGPSGFLGTNRADAQETVRALVDDLNAGTLAAPRPRVPRRASHRCGRDNTELARSCAHR